MKRTLLFSLVLFIRAAVLAQTKAESALALLDEKYPQEKVHLLFNKEEFVAGETVWFKAYVFSGYVLSYISTNLYVDWYDEKKQRLDSLVVPLFNGVGQGSFTIPKQRAEGSYYLRAYTRWMLNFDEALQYITSVPVYNPASAKALTPKKAKWTAAAFPESGNLLAGQENKVAVRLTTEGTLPPTWSGFITPKEDPQTKILSFSSFNPQLAAFTFTPAPEKEYLVHVTDEGGNRAIIPLQPTAAGVVLKAKRKGGVVNTEMIFQGLPHGGQNHKLVAHMQNQVVYSGIIRRKETVIRAAIPVARLMNGILHLTLFDEKENAVAERLLFIDNGLPKAFELSAVALNTEPRGHNVLSIMADTSQIQNFAVAVSDAGVTPPRRRSLYSDLWLGDFPSPIDNPAWYFIAEDPARLQALDALLLSEKWRRFAWSQVLADSFPSIRFQPDKYLSYTGKATRNTKPIAEEPLGLLLKFRDSSTQLLQVKTDQQGRFSLNGAAFYDTVAVYYKPVAAKNGMRNIAITFETTTVFSPYHASLPPSSFTLTDRKEGAPLQPMVMNALNAAENQARMNDRFTLLEEVKVKAVLKTAKEQLNKKLSSELFNTETQTLFDFVNEEQGAQAYNNIFDWLDGRVAGLNFRIVTESESGASLSRVGQRIPVMRNADVALFLDETPVDVEAIYSLPISDIAMVKVFRGYFLGAPGAGEGGAIAVYTKKGSINSAASLRPSGILAGYKATKPYVPLNYGEEWAKALQNDTRDVLYWNPSLSINTNGSAPFQFYNKDSPSQYRIIITGFTKDSQPIYLEEVFQKK